MTTQGDSPISGRVDDAASNGHSRLQHFQAPVDARQTYRRRYSDISGAPHTVASLNGGFDAIPQEPMRKSLDETELQSDTNVRRQSLPDVVVEAMRKRGARASISGIPTESADSKGRRYAEMMERFQIRRVTRTPSSASIIAISAPVVAPTGGMSTFRRVTSREHSDEHSAVENGDDHNHSYASSRLNVPPLGLRFSQHEKAYTFTDLGTRGDMHSAAMSTHEGTDSIKSMAINRSSRFSLYWWLVSWTRRMRRNINTLAQPISPSSTFSRIRLAILMLVFIAHLVMFPLETAFLPDVRHQRVDVEVVVEFVLIIDFVLMFNTAFYGKRNQLITSRRQIARHYVRGWFLPDLLSSIPVDFIIMATNSTSVTTKWLNIAFDIAVRSQRVVHLVRLARSLWIVLLDSPERSLFEWLLYSRYSHLLRIAWIIMCIILIAHYLACGWRLLNIAIPMRGSPLGEYVASFYDVLQMLQGQGVTTTSVAQNLYATAAILMGSIALAVIFGNVAILVSNFNAHTTSYQRKMESVFAIMSKLQLPAPLRERIHQYYEHLWREYESLDGEIVAFSKGLSHTLELEVVLFKYMDLIMHVPFWREGSPDFQKQLMLSVHVRVYLPDDYIMRRGEVGDEFYMLNRGVCELALGPDSLECTIEPLDEPDSSFSEADREHIEEEQIPKSARYELPSPPIGRGRRGHRGRIYSLGGARVIAEESSKYTQKLRRGQSFGELALVMNYERTANVRALTCVEMCVLHRHDFQQMLIKHPKDRKQVLAKMLAKTMENNEANNVWCPLKNTVQSVFGEGDVEKAEAISARHGALLISNAIDLPLDDESIKFGIGGRLREQLVELRDKQHVGNSGRTTASAPTFDPKPPAPPSPVVIIPDEPSMPSTPPVSATTIEFPSEPQHGEFQKLVDHVQQLEHVQTHMSNTLLELVNEVRLLRTSNEQLRHMVHTYETRLASLARPSSPETTSVMKSSVPSSTPDLRPVTRRLSRRMSQGTLDGVQTESIPENQPRVVPLVLLRSASMSSIHSSRVSVGPGDKNDDAPEDRVVSSELKRSGRRASYTASRSTTQKNLATTTSPPTKAASPTGTKTDGTLNTQQSGQPNRPSLNARLLMPFRSLLTADTLDAPTPSPTRYADHLFRDKPSKQ